MTDRRCVVCKDGCFSSWDCMPLIIFNIKCHSPADGRIHQLILILYCNMYWRFLTGIQAQEEEALLCLTTESSTQPAETAEPSETSRDTARSSDLRPVRSCQPAHTRTKHHSGSNVSFSHDTEGGEDDQTQVKPLCCTYLSESVCLKQLQENLLDCGAQLLWTCD